MAHELCILNFRIFEMMSEINSGGIFWLLPFNAVLMAVSMYNMENSTYDIVMITYNTFCLICSLIWPTLFCLFATNASIRLSSMATVAYDMNWYMYPVDSQKFMTLIIGRSQEPVYFTGFSFIRCTLEIFGKVYKYVVIYNFNCEFSSVLTIYFLLQIFKSSCSYYVLFRSLQP